MFLEKSSPKKKYRGLKGFFDFRNNQKNQIGLLFFIAFVAGTILIYQFEERFDENIWRSEPARRYNLVDDIIESQLLIGKTKDEVIALLGDSYSTLSLNQESFIYSLGKPPSFFEPKEELLVIVFVNQKVKEVTRLQD
jgi:hypothetical protein